MKHELLSPTTYSVINYNEQVIYWDSIGAELMNQSRAKLGKLDLS